MRTLRYVLCDVFTQRPLQGNALAVFTDARGLADETMQAIAREMNLSETAFVLAPSAGGQAKLRIFTPTHEVPFAGHPTLGSAFVLAGALQSEVIQFETGVGIVPVRVEREGASIVFGSMQQPIPSARPAEHQAELLAALGLERSLLPVIEYDNGIRHVFFVVESFAVVQNLKPNLERLKALANGGVSVLAVNGARVKTRMFAPALGVPEDPATGSAAGPLALHLAEHGQSEFGVDLQIEQGAEIARPSELSASVHGQRGHIERIEVGGAAVIVGRGELRIV